MNRSPYNSNREPRIGDIYSMCFDGVGSEQKGWRPGLIFQNNVGNTYSPNVIALPLTRAVKKRNQPTHVLVLAKETGLQADSMILCENPERMSKSKLGRYITTLKDEHMAKVAAANLLSSSAIAYIDPDLLLALWQKAVFLNEDKRGV